jgi:hypothetical protein
MPRIINAIDHLLIALSLVAMVVLMAVVTVFKDENLEGIDRRAYRNG